VVEEKVRANLSQAHFHHKQALMDKFTVNNKKQAHKRDVIMVSARLLLVRMENARRQAGKLKIFKKNLKSKRRN